jgi:hypothetical protein
MGWALREASDRAEGQALNVYDKEIPQRSSLLPQTKVCYRSVGSTGGIGQ